MPCGSIESRPALRASAAALARQRDAKAGPALRRAIDDNVAAMGQHDIPGDGQAEPDAAGRHVAGFVQSEERPEHVRPPFRREGYLQHMKGSTDGNADGAPEQP